MKEIAVELINFLSTPDGRCAVPVRLGSTVVYCTRSDIRALETNPSSYRVPCPGGKNFDVPPTTTDNNTTTPTLNLFSFFKHHREYDINYHPLHQPHSIELFAHPPYRNCWQLKICDLLFYKTTINELTQTDSSTTMEKLMEIQNAKRK